MSEPARIALREWLDPLPVPGIGDKPHALADSFGITTGLVGDDKLLPDIYCVKLGLPIASTYAQAGHALALRHTPAPVEPDPDPHEGMENLTLDQRRLKFGHSGLSAHEVKIAGRRVA